MPCIAFTSSVVQAANGIGSVPRFSTIMKPRE
jgi:hypothetical protein